MAQAPLHSSYLTQPAWGGVVVGCKEGSQQAPPERKQSSRKKRKKRKKTELNLSSPAPLAHYTSPLKPLDLQKRKKKPMQIITNLMHFLEWSNCLVKSFLPLHVPAGHTCPPLATALLDSWSPPPPPTRSTSQLEPGTTAQDLPALGSSLCFLPARLPLHQLLCGAAKVDPEPSPLLSSAGTRNWALLSNH